MSDEDLLVFTDSGIYCPQADVYIDPWKPVHRALITHGHADHSRWGHQQYVCTHSAKPVIKYRLGNIQISSLAYGETLRVNGVEFSFHPAGHIIGSAQIRVAYRGQIWVASGDYKPQNDGVSEPFELVKCHAFITESTFGLPIYKWQNPQFIFGEINQWWRENQSAGKVSVISSYALGKAQRIINGVDASIGPIFTHGAVENTNQVLRRQGIPIQPTTKVRAEMKKSLFDGALVVATPNAINSSWIKKFQPYSLAITSGWMALRGARRRRAADRGFILSDHADWEGLNQVVEGTGAEKVIVTHGYTTIFSKWLQEKGLDARTEQTAYEGELADIGEGSVDEKMEQE